jgi:hypothetical protein
VEGQARRPEGTGGMVAWRYVTPGYFGALEIPLERGRGFTAEDRGAGTHAVVVSRTLARQLFGAEDPVGKHILGDGPDGWYTVAGVAADVHNSGLATAPAAEYYLVRKPFPDTTFANAEPPTGWRAASVVLRTAIDPRFAAAGVRDAIARLDPQLPVEMETMRQRLDQLTGQPRFYATLLAVFAAAGALLALVALIAAAGPSRRAARLDPMESLREE